ncbi:MAG: hypothetical protein DRH11_17630 [Deltaproteobacteria bacterium]|nr:hypothetical protein [Deltaproteobacteria bacterium]MBW2083330.1 hypothetical protein [Deltaproteobacteria bacterium]RLB28227.1 MAG: hypothetical protein DRH11_17630 [Deltaproteobacteria bacterium]
MKLGDRRIRRIAIGLALILTCVLVWWARVYSPLRDKAHDLDIKLARLTVERHRLEKRLRRLSRAVKEKSRALSRSRRLPRTVKAKSLEEANAMIQARMQVFFEGHDIQLNAYKELPAGKWGEYQVGKVEFRLTCTAEKLAELLQYLGSQEEGICIDRLEISSRVRGHTRLRVILRLASLYIRGNLKGA